MTAGINKDSSKLSFTSREIERILAYDLQPWEKVAKIASLLERSNGAIEAAAFHIVMGEVRKP